MCYRVTALTGGDYDSGIRESLVEQIPDLIYTVRYGGKDRTTAMTMKFPAGRCGDDELPFPLLGNFEPGAVNNLAQFRLSHFLVIIGDRDLTLLDTDFRFLHAGDGLERLGDGGGALVALHARDADRRRPGGGKCRRQAEG